MGERKKNKNTMCKYTSYTGKYTLYTGIEKQRLFLMKNFFINIQTNVRATRTAEGDSKRGRVTETGRCFICNSVDSLEKVL